MNDDNRRRSDRAVRLQTFGRDHAADFTAGSKASALFAEMDRLLAQLDLARVGQLRGPAAKQAILDELTADFKAIARTARAIALDDPAFAAAPYAFTEQGVAMLSSVLRSPRAVEVNIAIMRTFVQLRRLMDSNALLAEKIEALEEKYADHDRQFQLVFDAIKQLIATPACPGIAKQRRIPASQRTRLPHPSLRLRQEARPSAQSLSP
jgi:hypothetical protein